MPRVLASKVSNLKPKDNKMLARLHRDLSIRARLLCSFGVLVIILLILAATGAANVDRTFGRFKDSYENSTIPLAELNRISYLAQRDRVLVMDSILNPTPDNIARRMKEFRANLDDLDRSLTAYNSTSMEKEERSLTEAFKAAWTPYLEQGLKPAYAALTNNSVDEARQIYVDKVSRLAPAFQESIVKLSELQLEGARQEFEESSKANTATVRTMMLASAAAIAVALGLAFVIARSIAVPLQSAVDVAKRVAQGDLRPVEADSRKDEVGQLLRALQEMQESLGGLVQKVRDGSHRVAQASAEIAGGNKDLSSRTEKQAGALQETASAMEEIGSTASGNADSARMADSLAKEAVSTAERGGTVVSEVAQVMQTISESSRKISEIIGVIDGIAFQTNILALNAAVEAARAGEHGRGFAVVAAEVRSLASNSADAAKQIKVLINESVTRVDHGAQLGGHAATSMGEVIGAIRQVMQVVSGIHGTSAEQSSAVNQVGQAIVSLDSSTQQNASLVEQIASVAHQLEQQSNDLVDAVAAFRV